MPSLGCCRRELPPSRCVALRRVGGIIIPHFAARLRLLPYFLPCHVFCCILLPYHVFHCSIKPAVELTAGAIAWLLWPWAVSCQRRVAAWRGAAIAHGGIPHFARRPFSLFITLTLLSLDLERNTQRLNWRHCEYVERVSAPELNGIYELNEILLPPYILSCHLFPFGYIIDSAS